MSILSFLLRIQPRLAPEGDASSGAGSTSGSGSQSGGSSGSSGEDRKADAGGGDDDRPLSRKDLQELLGGLKSENEKRFKSINDELKDRRHARREAEPKGAEGKGDDGGKNPDSGYSREDARADRRLEGVIAELEDAGVSRDVLEDLEAGAEEMPAKNRLSYAAAIKQAYTLGREAGSKGGGDREDNGDDTRSGDRRAGGGTKGTRGGRGGEPPPKPRGTAGSDITWDEYVEAKKDPKRKAELDRQVEAGELDLQAMRARAIDDRNRAQRRATQR